MPLPRSIAESRPAQKADLNISGTLGPVTEPAARGAASSSTRPTPIRVVEDAACRCESPLLGVVGKCPKSRLRVFPCDFGLDGPVPLTLAWRSYHVTSR